MLQNDLFTFTSPTIAGDIVKTGIKLNPLHPIFEGHFPGQPILPGVCMVQMVKEVAEAHVGTKLRLTIARDLKFLSFVTPENDKIIQLELKITIVDEQVNVVGQLLDEATILFKFKGTFARV